MESSEKIHFLTSSPAKQFIQENTGLSPSEIFLRHRSKYDFKELQLLVDQIQGKSKAKSKLPSWFSEDKVLYPPVVSLEQCSSEATAFYKSQLVTGDHLVDLTGGLGIDCLALSHGFDQSVYVEQDDWLSSLFDHNASVFGKVVNVFKENALDFVRKEIPQQLEKFTFYIDPSRRPNSNSRKFLLEDCEPNVIPLIPRLLNRGAEVLLKTSPMLDIKATLASLGDAHRVFVVALKNDVKEVLYHFKQTERNPPKICTIDLARKEKFDFDYNLESKLTANLGSLQSHLLEPNNAVLKAGAFKSIADRFGVSKVDINSHFYTSDQIPSGFPGRIFTNLELVSEKTLRRMQMKKINMISRNHPLSVPQLKKKFKLEEGGNSFLIGTRIQGKPTLLLADLLSKPS